MSTLNDITLIFNWLLGLLSLGLVVRCTHDIWVYSQDPNYGIGYALKKIKGRVFATIIALTITGTVAYIRNFYY